MYTVVYTEHAGLYCFPVFNFSFSYVNTYVQLKRQSKNTWQWANGVPIFFKQDGLLRIIKYKTAKTAILVYPQVTLKMADSVLQTDSNSNDESNYGH